MKISTDLLVPTQYVLVRGIVKRYMSQNTHPGLCVPYGGEYLILHGHHRAAAAHIMREAMDFRVLHDAKDAPPSWSAFCSTVEDITSFYEHAFERKTLDDIIDAMVGSPAALHLL